MYVTLAEFKTHLGVTSDKDDVILSGFLAAAQAVIEARTHRVFEAKQDRTRYLDAICNVEGRRLWLNDDLCAITAIVNGDGATVPPSAYLSAPREITPYYAIDLRGDAGISWCSNGNVETAIAITGRWAYTTYANADIQQATKQLAHWLYKQKDTSADLDRPLLTGDGVTLLPARLPAAVSELIHPYIRRH